MVECISDLVRSDSMNTTGLVWVIRAIRARPALTADQVVRASVATYVAAGVAWAVLQFRGICHMNSSAQVAVTLVDAVHKAARIAVPTISMNR